MGSACIATPPARVLPPPNLVPQWPCKDGVLNGSQDLEVNGPLP